MKKNTPESVNGPSRGKAFSASRAKIVGITMGDPAGIGPEIAVKAAAACSCGKNRVDGGIVIFGEYDILSAASTAAGRPAELVRCRTVAEALEVVREDSESSNSAAHSGCRAKALPRIPVVEPVRAAAGGKKRIVPGRPSAASGELSVRAVIFAVECAMAGAIHSIVTAPISKEAVAMAGYGWPGHTEMLGELSGAGRVEMAFAGPAMNLVLATRHLSLAGAIRAIDRRRVRETVAAAAAFGLSMGLGGKAGFTVSVPGLNPHAGEGGIFGREEIDVIAPAIASARRAIAARHPGRRITIEGPVPADTLFHAALKDKKPRVIVSLYHDQGLIPFKMLYLDEGVNVTLGLPFVRTSPDHGTAFDIAGKSLASHASMEAAIRLAVRMRPVEL